MTHQESGLEKSRRICATVPCKGCGKPIMWGVTKDGKRIPLDPRPPVYRMWTEADEILRVELDYTHAVSHFSTCAKASQF